MKWHIKGLIAFNQLTALGIFRLVKTRGDEKWWELLNACIHEAGSVSSSPCCHEGPASACNITSQEAPVASVFIGNIGRLPPDSHITEAGISTDWCDTWGLLANIYSIFVCFLSIIQWVYECLAIPFLTSERH